ncbi:DUF3226 domain-containing protein [Aeromonas veronii]|uniref:DUF3226 domain-containing protein n=1 Tax=Aeromonas veronii TaxID=654 RepID=UPI0024466013|nr:DUF3226 domain-containing protein [Aeromonas veronii]
MPLILSTEKTSQSNQSSISIHDAIVKKDLIFVEGPDDEHFIKAILKEIDLEQSVQIIRTGGITSFPSKFQAKIKESMFGKVQRFAIIVDADDSKEKAFKLIKKTLTKNNFSAPNKHGDIILCDKEDVYIGVFIISKPGEDTGMLEDLFIDTQKSTPILKHVDNYFSNLASALEKYIPQQGVSRPKPEDFKYPNNESKAKARTILASFYDDISTVGYAAQRGYVDMKSTSLDDLKSFLNDIFKR